MAEQNGFAFPAPLTEKYRPKRLADFAGLERQKKIFGKLVADGRSLIGKSFLFTGAPGTGKTTLALAICEQVGAELHHIGARDCTIDTIREVVRRCYYIPFGGGVHVILIDEADTASKAAQDSLLSYLDATEMPPNTCFIFTCNGTDRLEPRFISRCMEIPFSTYGISEEVTALLRRVWTAEAPAEAPTPNFGRIVKDSANNCRAALMALEVALLEA